VTSGTQIKGAPESNQRRPAVSALIRGQSCIPIARGSTRILLIRADKAFGLHLDVLGFLICGLIVFASEIRQQGRVEWC